MNGDCAPGAEAVTPAMLEAAERWSFEAFARNRWKRALRMLLAGESLTSKSAAKDYGEFKLADTIAEIKRRGVRLSMRPEISFSALGPMVLRPHLVRAYTLRPESRALAAQLLAGGADALP